jgi:endonuclease/exonuclease/phosphatase (EEP) superfamily protein YafD
MPREADFDFLEEQASYIKKKYQLGKLTPEVFLHSLILYMLMSPSQVKPPPAKWDQILHRYKYIRAACTRLDISRFFPFLFNYFFYLLHRPFIALAINARWLPFNLNSTQKATILEWQTPLKVISLTRLIKQVCKDNEHVSQQTVGFFSSSQEISSSRAFPL